MEEKFDPQPLVDVGRTTCQILGLPTASLEPGDVEFVIGCVVCNKGLVLKGKAAPQSASEFLSLCVTHNVPHVIDWDRDGRIVSFCCGEHLRMALTKDGQHLKRRIPRIK